MMCPMPGCQTTAGCQCRYTTPMLGPVPREFYPVNLPKPQWSNETTVARLDFNGKLTVGSEYPSDVPACHYHEMINLPCPRCTATK